MSITRKHTNARMSQIVVDGGIVYLAGQVSIPEAGDSVAAQTTDILARIEAYLVESGSDKSQLLTATIWLSDVSTFAEVNAVWDKWVPEGTAPARACVETRFPMAHVKVEVMVTARQV
jgi:enamine deaminase RidA (YjgF/YER057c/UK114 family)